MAHTSANVLVKWLIAAMFIAMLSGANAVVFCKIDSNRLHLCYDAVTGTNPPKPSKQCCKVVQNADLPCLCNLKSYLPALGINPTNAFALPSKCGIATPPECKGI